MEGETEAGVAFSVLHSIGSPAPGGTWGGESTKSCREQAGSRPRGESKREPQAWNGSQEWQPPCQRESVPPPATPPPLPASPPAASVQIELRLARQALPKVRRI